jgi:nitrite reductase/ring-hydroxylating ferredoxin subunit
VIFLCRTADLQDPGTANIILGEGDDDELDVVIVMFEGTAHAYINCCPHQFIPLETFPNHFLATDKRHLVCSGHGALFDPETGLCAYGPCIGQKLDRLNIAERDGVLYLDEEHPPAQIARSKRASRRW